MYWSVPNNHLDLAQFGVFALCGVEGCSASKYFCWFAMQGLVLLCHVTRRVSEQQVIGLATNVGLVAKQIDSKDFQSGPIRLLCFGKDAARY